MSCSSDQQATISSAGAARELARRTHESLAARDETVSCAESLTGGALAALLSATPGASSTFAGAIVSYATRVKRDLLAVTATEIVSADCAVQMATAARERLGTRWALATTGVAGPDTQEDQPVGTVFVALAGPAGAVVRRLALTGDRDAIRADTCAEALRMLLDALD